MSRDFCTALDPRLGFSIRLQVPQLELGNGRTLLNLLQRVVEPVEIASGKNKRILTGGLWRGYYKEGIFRCISR